MMHPVEQVLLEVLKNGLSGLVDPDHICIGGTGRGGSTSVILSEQCFHVRNESIGDFGGARQTECEDTFSGDNQTTVFTLTQHPQNPILAVEHPQGNRLGDPDGYTADYRTGTITFRVPPGKGGDNILVRYTLASSVAEILHVAMTYDYIVTVSADTRENRDTIAIEIIRTLYRDRDILAGNGVLEVRINEGYPVQISDDDASEALNIECSLDTIIQVEMPVPPIEKVEIGNKK
jgi:hypothetical protein